MTYLEHKEPVRDKPVFSDGDPILTQAVEDHLNRCYPGRPQEIFGEVISPWVKVNVHVAPPTRDYPVRRLVTSGMAEKPMSTPPGSKAPRHAELTVALPDLWPLRGKALRKRRNRWPIEMLSWMGRVPHEFGTYLYDGHTVTNGMPMGPFGPNTKLCGALIMPPQLASDEFCSFKCPDGRKVEVLAVIPLHEDEMYFARDESVEELIERLDAAGVTDVIDPRRPSVIGD